MDDEQIKALIQKHTNPMMAGGVSMDVNVPPNNHAVTTFNKEAFAKELLELEMEKIADWLDYEYIPPVYIGRHRVQHDIADKIRKGEHDG